MVPGRLSALPKLINPRRYWDPEFLNTVGGDLYGAPIAATPVYGASTAAHMRPPQALDKLDRSELACVASTGWRHRCSKRC